MPQLASGELAWAIDTQELYIGNGAVSEGAPAVGNTKILTENDLGAQSGLLDIISYTYQVSNTALQPDVYIQVPRSIQNRLDDYVNTNDFGVDPELSDVTVELQYAINQLFLNAGNSYAYLSAGTKNRLYLTLPPGVFNITSTIYVPSYATLVGAGSDKTIISYTGTGPAIQFVNDTSTPGNPSTLSSTVDTSIQPRHIALKGLTVQVTDGNSTCLQLDAVAHSTFEDIKLIGSLNTPVFSTTPTSDFNTASVGIALNALSNLVTSENNIFNNVQFVNLTFGVFSSQDIINNTFTNCVFEECYMGVVFGYVYDSQYDKTSYAISDRFAIGSLTGPVQNQILSCKFINIYAQAVLIGLGNGNLVDNAKMVLVGNFSTGIVAQCPQVYSANPGNNVTNLFSDRTLNVGSLANLNTIPYVPEAGGWLTYSTFTPVYPTLLIAEHDSSQNLFRLPVSTDELGNPRGSAVYTVEYTYISSHAHFTRRGTLTIASDTFNTGGNVYLYQIQLSDEYDFAGTDSAQYLGTTSTQLDFTANFVDADGVTYNGSNATPPSSILVKYTNTLPSDAGYLTFSYTVAFTKP